VWVVAAGDVDERNAGDQCPDMAVVKRAMIEAFKRQLQPVAPV
jgi:hypothetical protein